MKICGADHHGEPASSDASNNGMRRVALGSHEQLLVQRPDHLVELYVRFRYPSRRTLSSVL
jgi:hypothetical protein